MVVGFTNACAISALPITTNVVSSSLIHGKVCSIQHYVIKFVSDLRQVSGFLRVLRIPPPIKRYNWNIVESGVKHHTLTLSLKSDLKLINIIKRNVGQITICTTLCLLAPLSITFPLLYHSWQFILLLQPNTNWKFCQRLHMAIDKY